MRDMENTPDSSYEALADHCRRINSNYGVPIILRHGSEMNGKSIQN